MKNILICGSIAYDTIMVFEDYFKNHILPDKIHKLSVSFYVPELKKNLVVQQEILHTILDC